MTKTPTNGDSIDLISEKQAKAFARHVRALNKLIAEIRRDVPSANFYLALDTLHILSGSSHARIGGHTLEPPEGSPRDERSIVSMTLDYSGGGDW